MSDASGAFATEIGPLRGPDVNCQPIGTELRVGAG
jgi:hypothetical protein